MGTEKPLSMHMTESHLIHQPIDLKLAQASSDYILTHVDKQLVSVCSDVNSWLGVFSGPRNCYTP